MNYFHSYGTIVWKEEASIPTTGSDSSTVTTQNLFLWFKIEDRSEKSQEKGIIK
jgi:hypothetical protein